SRCCARRLFLEKKLRQSGEEILEGLEVRSAAEEIMEDFVLNVRHQLDEHFVSLRLVFDERIFLGVTAQINALAQRVHRVEMLLPEAVDRLLANVALASLLTGRVLIARFAIGL